MICWGGVGVLCVAAAREAAATVGVAGEWLEPAGPAYSCGGYGLLWVGP